MGVAFNNFPPQKSRIFAFSPANPASRKSVKYISSSALTINKRIRLKARPIAAHLFSLYYQCTKSLAAAT